VLKPLIRGESEVALDKAGQTAFAAWLFKCALIFDVVDAGTDGPLAPLRQAFMETRLAPPGCVIYSGPASAPPSVKVGEPSTSVNLWMFGVRPANGTLWLTANVQGADGQVTPGTPTPITIPGYQVMVGALWAYIGGSVAPVAPEALQGFERTWPARDEKVIFRATSLNTASDD
jgi:hypothetical protein